MVSHGAPGLQLTHASQAAPRWEESKAALIREAALHSWRDQIKCSHSSHRELASRGVLRPHESHKLI